jgi:dCTP deaminase
MPISQISFVRLTTAADKPYGSGAGNKYQGQTGPEPSRYYLNYRHADAPPPSRPHRRRR